jgi:anti-sigma regulatory factor (Ser/Thr protein kinase)
MHRVPLRPVRAGELGVRTFSTNSRPALRAASGRPPARQRHHGHRGAGLTVQPTPISYGSEGEPCHGRPGTTRKPGTVVNLDRQPAPAPRRLELHVRATPKAPAQARRALQQLELPLPLADAARLAVSELVTNSVRHAGLGPDDLIHITADWSGTRLRVQVRDGGRGRRPAQVPASIRPAPGAESGWGLYLVDRLTSRWGTLADGYWFELQHE